MSLDRDVHLLRNIVLLDVLDDEELQLIAFNAERRRFRAGDILFKEGEAAASALVIVAGEVALSRAADAKGVSTRYCGPGSLIGEMAMIANLNRPATARAQSHGEMLVISRQLFHRVLEEFPDSAGRLQGKIAARLRMTVGDLATVRPLFDDVV